MKSRIIAHQIKLFLNGCTLEFSNLLLQRKNFKNKEILLLSRVKKKNLKNILEDYKKILNIKRIFIDNIIFI